MPDKLTAFDIAEGLHLAHAASALQEAGVFAELTTPTSFEAVASRLGLNASLLCVLLAYLAERTDLIERCDDGYRITEQYDLAARFVLDQYVGAYAPNGASLADLLRDPSRARDLVNRERQALAFDRLPGPGVAVLPDVLEELNLNYVLDLGCGPGGLLVAMAQRNETFFGWGLDASPAMCEAARSRIAAADVSDRIRIFEGNCTQVKDIVPNDVQEQIRALTAASLINEFFSPDSGPAVALLKYLQQHFSDRLLVIADYYGRLCQPGQSISPKAGLHDYIQAISGQGIPPANAAAWQEIYAQSGCTLLHGFDNSSGEFFIHLVQLSDATK